MNKFHLGYPLTSTGHTGTCESCNHWEAGRPGKCRRFPPVDEYRWRKTWVNDYCGEYNENTQVTKTYPIK